MPHGMGTFDYNHWGTLEHFSFPLLHQSRLPAHFPGVASCWILHYHIFYLSAFASVKNCTIHCCYLSCLAKWFSKWQKKTNRPVVSEKNNSLWGESTLHLCACSVFVMLSSSLRGPLEGQWRICRELSRGFLVVVNSDLRIEAYSTAVHTKNVYPKPSP